jgi:flavin reductase (DIM6/NTAB) family NADH-FMN oxidoreductase RutF
MVTSEVDGEPWGLTVSACCSVSLEPPTILVSVARHTATAAAVSSSASFGVSILGADLLDAARFGSAPGTAKFVRPFCLSAEVVGGRSRSPVVSGCLAHVDATVSNEITAGDHVIYLGAVHNVLCLDEDDDPLVYFGGRYRSLRPGEVGAAAPSEAVDSLLYPHPIPLQFRLSNTPAEKGA